MEAPFLRFRDFTLSLLFGSYSKFYHFSKFACFQNVLNYRKKRKQRQKYLFFNLNNYDIYRYKKYNVVVELDADPEVWPN